MNNRYQQILTTILLIVAVDIAVAANRYVATSGTNTPNTCLTQSSPCLTLQYAFSQMVSNDVLIIADGLYAGAVNDLNNNIKNGSNGAYTIIRAQNDGGVVITSEFLIGSDNTRKSYIEFHGLKINSANNKSIIGDHIKVFRTAFQGGPNGGNNSNLGIGTTDTAKAGSHHILLEDVWSYGLGGRYNILIYNSEDIIVRRAVIRHDGGWTLNVSSDPESGIVIYNSSRVQLQNVIVLDSIADSVNWASAFYNVNNGNNSFVRHDSTRTVGSLAINNNNNNTSFPCTGSGCVSNGTGFAWDDSLTMTNASLENSVAYNSGTSITSNGADKFVTINNVTLYGGAGDGIAKYGNGGAFTVRNTIINGKAGKAFNSGVSATNTTNVFCSNIVGATTACDTVNTTTPASNGLIYLPRTESGGYFSNNNLGANIIFKTGTSGTYYGDTGYDIDTTDALWPWPYQDRIAADMCPVRNSGLCATTLTTYIWGLLGAAVPTEFAAMPTPANFSVTKN